MSSPKISKHEILSALSVALDLVEGQPEGHAVRTAWLALRIADVMGLVDGDQTKLYYAALVKDAGCSNNSARIHAIFGGDEFASKRAVKLIDWTKTTDSLKFAMQYTERGGGLAAKIRRMSNNLGHPKTVMNQVTLARCGRGAEIALELGFEPEVAHAIMNLDEHWDGNGSPSGRCNDRIPILARILCLAQTLEVFVTAFGSTCAFEMVRDRSGTWFDPEVARAALTLENNHAIWIEHAHMLESGAIDLAPPQSLFDEAPANVDRICAAFAKIVDAKSAFTGEHSTRVTEYACSIAAMLDWPKERVGTLRRAALLHDIGKLGIPNRILEKPSALNEAEFDIVKLHPANSERIIGSIEDLRRESEIAGAHHEKLDGTGYPQGRDSGTIDMEMRVLAAADVFDALTANRPYREPLTISESLIVMEKTAGTHLDATVIEALRTIYGNAASIAA